ncbi:MAG: hypothetical protein P4L84_30235 [Isosphaeraceae bacterium]|nr:hypothetical protein [Isosphaeraceae bacterium]
MRGPDGRGSRGWRGIRGRPIPGPKDLWSPFIKELAVGFAHLCAYTVIHEPVGTVDHYLSCKRHRDQVYEWSNYRFAGHKVNGKKGELGSEVLDPFEAVDGWFEILLPSLQLIVTDAVAPEHRQRAEFTLERLGLRDEEWVIRQRRAWYELYENGKLTLAGLEERAPLIARAVRKQRAQAPPKRKGHGS